MIKVVQTILLSVFVFALAPGFSANVDRAELLKAADIKASGEYVRKRFLQIMKKPFDQADKKKALIIGDSHAQDFLNAILEGNYLSNYQISTRYIPVRCQVSFGNSAAQYIAAKDKNFCANSDSLSQAKKQIAEADLIILVANWKDWSAKLLPQTIAKLGLKQTQKLFVIGRKSFGKITVRKYMRMSDEKLAGLRNQPESQHIKINELMEQTLDKEVFVNLHQQVCGANDDCPVFTPSLKLISFDGGHLTKDGAKYIGKILFQNTLLGEL